MNGISKKMLEKAVQIALVSLPNEISIENDTLYIHSNNASRRIYKYKNGMYFLYDVTDTHCTGKIITDKIAMQAYKAILSCIDKEIDPFVNIRIETGVENVIVLNASTQTTSYYFKYLYNEFSLYDIYG